MKKIAFINKLFTITLAMICYGCSAQGPLLIGKEIDTIPTSQERFRVIFKNDLSETKNSQHAVTITSKGKIIAGLQPGQQFVEILCGQTAEFRATILNEVPKIITLQATNAPVQLVTFNTAAQGSVEYEITAHPTVSKALGGDVSRSFLVPRGRHTCDRASVVETFNLSAQALFAFDSDRFLNIGSTDTLVELYNFIDSHRTEDMRMIIEGHTDRLGNDDYNIKLSKLRAEAVAKYLREQGFRGTIQTYGFGSSQPTDIECSKTLDREAEIECLQPNRRVTIQLLKPSQR